MKKIIVFCLIALTLAQPVFSLGTAIGGALASVAVNAVVWVVVGTVAATSAPRVSNYLVGKEAVFLNNLGSYLSHICKILIVRLHPFPDKFASWHGMDVSTTNDNVNNSVDTLLRNKPDPFSLKDLITSSGAGNNTFSFKFLLDKEGNLVEEDEDNNNLEAYQTSTITIKNANVKQKVGVVTVLFGVLLVAEMLFYLIWGYVINGHEKEFPLKTVLVKFAVAVAIFFVLMALPYLIEWSHYLFGTLLNEWYGSELGIMRYGDGEKARLLASDEAYSIFNLPKIYMQSMAFHLDSASPLKVMRESKDLLTVEKEGYFKSALISLVFLIFAFSMCVVIIQTGLHILYNIVEVYILLVAVMFLVPFSLFTPVKFIGEKAIQSLVTNLLECFILMLLITLVLPVSNELVNMYRNIIVPGEYKKDSVSVPIKIVNEIGKRKDKIEETYEDSLIEFGTGYEFDEKNPAAENGIFYSYVVPDLAMLYGSDVSSSTDAGLTEEIKNKIALNEGFKKIFGLDDKKLSVGVFYGDKTQLSKANLGLDESVSWFNFTDLEDKLKEFHNNVRNSSESYNENCYLYYALINQMESIFKETRFEVASGYSYESDAYNRETGLGTSERHDDSYYSLFREKFENRLKKERKESDIFPKSLKWDLTFQYDIENASKYSNRKQMSLLVHLLLSFIGIYIPTYFVRNSTMLTIGLMNGSANWLNRLDGQLYGAMRGSLLGMTRGLRNVTSGINRMWENKDKKNENNSPGSPAENMRK